MAERLIVPGTAPANSETTSPILAIHNRYEAAWREYNDIDRANTKLNRKNEAEQNLSYRYENAMRANNAETDALRLAILYQVPTTWQEALVLQFHIQSIFDPCNSSTDDESNALTVAVETLFDFMCDEVEHEDVEGLFQISEHMVSDNRRRRTGKLEA